MTHDEAVELLTRTIVDIHGLGALTAVPSRRQSEALRSVAPGATAPARVCIEVDLEPGSTWGAVVGLVAADAVSPDSEDVDEGWVTMM
jgi:hypothetical protein